MSALQQVQMHDYNDNLVVTTLFQLTQWKHGLKAELKGFAVTSDGTDSETPVYDHLLKFLSVPSPRDLNIATMFNYVCQTIQSLHELMYDGDTSKLDEEVGVTPNQVADFLMEVGYI